MTDFSIFSVGGIAAGMLSNAKHGKIIAVFSRSLYLQCEPSTTHAGIICIGDLSIGRGPLNVLVAGSFKADQFSCDHAVAIGDDRIDIAPPSGGLQGAGGSASELVAQLTSQALSVSLNWSLAERWSKSVFTNSSSKDPEGNSLEGGSFKLEGSEIEHLKMVSLKSTTQFSETIYSSSEFIQSLHKQSPSVVLNTVLDLWRSSSGQSSSAPAPTQGNRCTANNTLSSIATAIRQLMSVEVSLLKNWLHEVSAPMPPNTIADTGSSRLATSPPESIVKLLGAGDGLTPAGDDFLCGVLLALRRLDFHDQADTLWACLSPSLDQRTNLVSAAHLEQAAAGRCCEAALRILDTCCSPNFSRLNPDRQSLSQTKQPDALLYDGVTADFENTDFENPVFENPDCELQILSEGLSQQCAGIGASSGFDLLAGVLLVVWVVTMPASSANTALIRISSINMLSTNTQET